MAFTPELESDETLLLHESYAPSQKSEPFSIAVSDRAVYVPMKRTFAIKDPYYFRRIPFTDLHSITVRKLSPVALWAVAILMIVVGGLTTAWMLAPVLAGEGGKVSGIPLGVLAVGVVLPFTARKRRGLIIEHQGGKFVWKPPLVIDAASKRRIEALLSGVLQTCRGVGLRVIDEAAQQGDEADEGRLELERGMALGAQGQERRAPRSLSPVLGGRGVEHAALVTPERARRRVA